MSLYPLPVDGTTARCSGRTTMHALHIVQLILDNPGEWVDIDDHHQKSPHGDRHLFGLVRNVLHALRVEHHADSHQMKIRVTRPLNPYVYPSAEQCIQAERSKEVELRYRLTKSPHKPFF